MIISKKRILVSVLLLFGFVINGNAQHNLKFEINSVQPFVSLQEKKLETIGTLSDINYRFPSSWISEFISVEISAFRNGEQVKASGASDVLNQSQKDLILHADRNREIAVAVKYIPNNTLKKKEEKQLDFTVSIMPSTQATFGSGDAELIRYLMEKGISKIDPSSFAGYDLTAIKFTVTEQGKVSNVEVSIPSKDLKTDEMLISALLDMQGWKAAEFSNGVKIDQTFILFVGNMDNCMANLFNVRQID